MAEKRSCLGPQSLRCEFVGEHNPIELVITTMVHHGPVVVNCSPTERDRPGAHIVAIHGRTGTMTMEPSIGLDHENIDLRVIKPGSFLK